MATVRRAVPGDLPRILELQRKNLDRNLSPAEASSQGFVTVEHTPEALSRMHAIEPAIVASEGETLCAYALVMPAECRGLVPELQPMFQRLEELRAEGFYVMGQICIDRPSRGSGLFDRLYAAHRQHLSGRYQRVVTEVATRNTRSMRAHARVGFRELLRYRDETDEWSLVAWDWS